MMSLQPSEVKWRKITSQSGSHLAVKGEKTRPDERFAMLDWRDYIEISKHYTKEEHELIVRMLDDVTANIPEVRSLLRLTKDPVVHFYFKLSEHEIPDRVPAHEKLMLQPQLKTLIIKDQQGASFKNIRPAWTKHSYKSAFQSVMGLKTIVLEPSMVSEIPMADAHGKPYKPSFAELFIHELVHQAMPSSPIEELTNKIAREYHQNSLKNALRSAVRGNFSPFFYSAVITAEAEHDQTLNVERMTVPVTNMIGKRYFGTPYRNAYYFATVKPDHTDTGRDNFRLCRHSNLLPISYVDLPSNQWRSHINAFRELQREFPEEYNEIEKNFVNNLRHSYAESMER